ncbi:MAG: methyltransferase domain-containing protein [Gemmataceae bacterium]
MPPLRRIEREFGVPFPGTILSEDRWTQTALKSMPDGHLDWAALFGRQAPVMLDLGCGNGRSTMHSAVSRHHFDHLGVDTLPVVIRYARKRGNQRGLTNVKFAVIGGHELLERHVAPGSVTEIHIYHPQPYYDPATIHKRLVTPTFLALVHRCLIPGGMIVLQTDHPKYWQYIRDAAALFFDFHERIGRWADSPRGRTRREILAIKKGLPVFRGHGTAKPGLSESEAIRLAESLPPPTFDADRRLLELDRLDS